MDFKAISHVCDYCDYGCTAYNNLLRKVVTDQEKKAIFEFTKKQHSNGNQEYTCSHLHNI